jgi:hypothetical protein
MCPSPCFLQAQDVDARLAGSLNQLYDTLVDGLQAKADKQ